MKKGEGVDPLRDLLYCDSYCNGVGEGSADGVDCYCVGTGWSVLVRCDGQD